MLRYLPASLEVAGLLLACCGAFLIGIGPGLIVGGVSVVLIGYALEEAT